MAAAGTIPLLEAHGAIAAKLGNLNVRYWETFAKVRSAGKQVIEVQHVHIYPGGQAVVGTVNNGGGADAGIAAQPHALAYSPGETVPCTNAEREAVPVPRDQGEAPLQNARERGRGSEG